MTRNIDKTTREVTRLWTLAQPRISAFVSSMVRDYRDRDDLMQDIAVAVFDSFDSYDPGRPFRGLKRRLPIPPTTSSTRRRQPCAGRHRQRLRFADLQVG